VRTSSAELSYTMSDQVTLGSRPMTILGRSLRSGESSAFLARIARADRPLASRRSPIAELPGMINPVRAVDFTALRDLIDGKPFR
jgi:hypothetical protein